MNNKIKLKRFILTRNLNFGDFILFQEYKQGKYENGKYNYIISKPILAVFVNTFPADQTIGFNYVKWENDNRVIDYEPEVKYHIEWDDYIDLLGQWHTRPTWKEILKAYRTQNSQEIINSNEINWKD